jgi:hypothetical protein
MAPLAAQLPGRLDLAFRRGDEFATLLDFSIDLTGYTSTAAVSSRLTGVTVATFAVTAVNLATGQINLSLTEIQTAALAAGDYDWTLVWSAPGVVTRTALSGLLEVSP